MVSTLRSLVWYFINIRTKYSPENMREICQNQAVQGSGNVYFWASFYFYCEHKIMYYHSELCFCDLNRISLSEVVQSNHIWATMSHAHKMQSWKDFFAYFRFDDDNKAKCRLSQSSQGKWENWKQT